MIAKLQWLVFVEVLAVCATAFGQPPDLPTGAERLPGQHDIAALFRDGKRDEAITRLLSIIKEQSKPDEKVFAFQMLRNLRKLDPNIEPSVLDDAFEIVEQQYADVNEFLQYSVDSYLVEREITAGDWAKAARVAGELRKKWQEKTSRVLTVYSDEPILLYRAGNPKQAHDLVTDTWLKFPNSYYHNEAVRLKLAVYLSDIGDFDTAFTLVDELRESFPEEFKKNPYSVQNWVNFATRAKLGDTDDEATRRLFEVAEFAQSLVSTDDYERVRPEIHYGVACLLEKANDIDSAKRAYELVIQNPGEGQMGKNLLAWSSGALERLNNPKPPIRDTNAPKVVPPRIKEGLPIVLLVNVAFVIALAALIGHKYISRNPS